MRCLSSAETQSLAHVDAAEPLAPAIAHREAGRYAEAAAWLTEYLVSHPDDAQALAHLAHTQLLCRQDAAAHTALARAESLAPDSPLVLRNRARLALKSGKIDDAAAAATRALVIDPADREHRLVWALVLATKGDAASAMQIVNALLAETPDYAEALLNRAFLHMRKQNPAAATADACRAAAIKPHLSQAWRLLAALHTQEQRTEAALSALQRYCGLEPEDVIASNALGEMLRQNGRACEALVMLARAVELKPDFVAAWINYGAALQQLKRLDEAKTAYRKALAVEPNCADAVNNLGAVFIGEGNWSEAVTQFNEALTLKPDYAEARMNLGVALRNQGKLDEAITHLEHALRLKPGDAEAHCNLGNALLDLKRPEDALANYDKAIALNPHYAELYSNRGNALRDLNRPEEALASHDRALSLRPDYVKALNNRGVTLHELKRYDEALACYDRALALQPDHADALNNRGSTLYELKRYNEALASYDRALTLHPDHADALYNRGNALRELNRFEEALASYDRALAVTADHAYAFSGVADCVMKLCDWDRRTRFATDLCAHVSGKKSIVSAFGLLGYSGDPALQLQCARNYIENKIPSPPPPLWSGQTWRHDKLRVAYLSPDFRSHAVAFLTAELFEQHDRSRFEIIGGSFGVDDRSEMRQRLIAAFDEFHDVRRNSDKEVAKLLNDRQVDIAVDLAGYTRDGRPGILAHRPVPIQVSYLGFPATMGADFIDYIIADAMVLPVEHQSYYTEKVVYLPDCYLVNDTKRNIAERTPTRQEMRLPEHAFVFCCFNNHWKITPEIFDIWMRLLHQVEDSVLWLSGTNEGAERNLRKEAQRRGIDPSRLVFAGRLPLAEHLARHRLADLFLDTLPYNAHTTASDALWVGLPVLTCKGQAFAGRVAASLLHAVGIPELITSNLEDYQMLALKLARDPALLAEIKAKLVRHRNTYPLFNTERFARHIEAAYTTMWETWERGEAPKSFSVEPIGLAGSVGVAHASPISEIPRHS